jgi:hypothetical protein
MLRALLNQDVDHKYDFYPYYSSMQAFLGEQAVNQAWLPESNYILLGKDSRQTQKHKTESDSLDR